MHVLPYDHPFSLFRVYQPWECDAEGYPFIWREISEYRRCRANNRCRDCGTAYLAEKSRRKRVALTVHHFDKVKSNCEWGNLVVLCWLCHQIDHSPTYPELRHYYCRRCKQGGFLGWAHYRRQIRGFHMPVTLTKIIAGETAVDNSLGNAQTVTCPRCTQAYRLAYSDSEWHRLKDWQGIAATALRRDHAARHELASIPIVWRGIRKR